MKSEKSILLAIRIVGNLDFSLFTLHFSLFLKASALKKAEVSFCFFLFSVMFTGNAKRFATLSATSRKYAATIRCFHTMTETVLVHSLSVVGLKCSFHCLILYLLLSNLFHVPCTMYNVRFSSFHVPYTLWLTCIASAKLYIVHGKWYMT